MLRGEISFGLFKCRPTFNLADSILVMKRHAGRFFYVFLVFALIGGAVLLRYADPFFVRALRLIAFDNFQRLVPAPYDPDLPIRVVDIDEKSLSILRSVGHGRALRSAICCWH